MSSKIVRRKKTQLIKYMKTTEPYGDILSSKELTAINHKIATRIAKKRAGLRGRR